VIEAGRVGRPHGLDGSFHVTRPLPELLVAGAPLVVADHPRVIERRAGTDEAPIVRLEGFATREEIEALRGAPLFVDEADAPPLEEGEFWAHELAGCRVVDGAVEVGVVERMVALPSCEALEVARVGQGAPLLVPLVRDAVRSVDVDARVIDVNMAFLGESAP
jgi:16S rRNA processing protein RimM